MFEGLYKIMYKGKPMYEYKFYVMGQVCVAAAYRGRGVFDMLYQQHRQLLQHKYDFVINGNSHPQYAFYCGRTNGWVLKPSIYNAMRWMNGRW